MEGGIGAEKPDFQALPLAGELSGDPLAVSIRLV
jgi:hypothetical protein